MTKSEFLAKIRTDLANERTFLAYFRTFVVTLSSGLALLNVEILSNLRSLGIALTAISPIILIIGIIRFYTVKIKIRKEFQKEFPGQ